MATGRTGALEPGSRLPPALLAGLAMALAAIATWRGPGLTIDSVQYMATGVNLADGEGLVMLADQPLTIFPPVVPVLAALGEVVGLGAERMLHLVSVVSFGAIVLLGYRLLERTVPNRAVVLGATGVIAVSPALLSVMRMAWSEPLFIAVTLVHLLVLGRVAEARTVTRRDVGLLAGLCWAAFLVRYVGLSLVPVTGIVLLATVRPLDRRHLARLVLLGASAAALPLGWMLRNHAADGTYLGIRLPSHDSLREVAVRTAATFGSWIVPVDGASTRALALVGGVGTLALLAGLGLALRTGVRTPRLVTSAVFACGFVGYLTAAALYTSFEPTNTRYLSPVFVPATIVAAAGTAAWLSRPAHARSGRVLAGTLLALIAAHLVVSADDARRDAADGIAFNREEWTDSDLAGLAAGLAEETEGAVLYSNQPFGLWAGTRLQPVRWAPRDVGFRGAPLVGELEALERLVECADAPVFLVRYRFGDQRVLSIEELRAAVDVRRVLVADDGAVFALTSNEERSCTIPETRPSRTR